MRIVLSFIIIGNLDTI